MLHNDSIINTVDNFFPNGLEDYLETYFEVVAFITNDINLSQVGIIANTEDAQGMGGLYLLAKRWTDRFETLYKGRQWDGDFFDTIDKCLIKWNKGENIDEDW